MKKIIENNKCLYFLKELLKYKKEIGILSISTIVSTVTVFLQPLLIKQITDIGILEKNMPQIVNGVAGLFVCVLVYLTESRKSPASIAKSNKQWVGTCLYQEECKLLLISCGAAIRL